MQLSFDEKKDLVYGSDYLTTRRGRRPGGRPITTRTTMHFTLRSTLAVGAWSFRRHKTRIDRILNKFANRNGVKLISTANVGNHLHLHLRLGTRHTYRRFICAITSAIAMAVTGASRWNKLGIKFWDRRPFSRIVRSSRAFDALEVYIRINQLEGEGVPRAKARKIAEREYWDPPLASEYPEGKFYFAPLMLFDIWG